MLKEAAYAYAYIFIKKNLIKKSKFTPAVVVTKITRCFAFSSFCFRN